LGALGILAVIAIFVFVIIPVIFVKKAGVTTQDTKEEVSNKLQQTMFLSSLPDKQITDVFIGGYGVPNGTLELIEQVIKDKIGVGTSIEAYSGTLPMRDNYYDKSRGQFDGDAVWQYFIDTFADRGDTVRYLIVVNEDMYTKLQPERPYIFSRASFLNNTAVISVKRLKGESTSSTEIYQQRVEKLALRTLGVTVGFSLSPDADNINCVMYQALTLEDLDRVGSIFCEETETAFNKAFLINH